MFIYLILITFVLHLYIDMLKILGWVYIKVMVDIQIYINYTLTPG